MARISQRLRDDHTKCSCSVRAPFGGKQFLNPSIPSSPLYLILCSRSLDNIIVVWGTVDYWDQIQSSEHLLATSSIIPGNLTLGTYLLSILHKYGVLPSVGERDVVCYCILQTKEEEEEA